MRAGVKTSVWRSDHNRSSALGKGVTRRSGGGPKYALAMDCVAKPSSSSRRSGRQESVPPRGREGKDVGQGGEHKGKGGGKMLSMMEVPRMAALAATVTAAGCIPAVAGHPEAEMVSVGYGEQSSRNVTGAIGSVHGVEQSEVGGTTVVEFLQSRVPGLRVVTRPDGDLSVRIRGAPSSLDGEPLVVIDGTPIFSGRLMSAFAGLTMSDIERVDVLKDAGSTAIFGIHGGNGVILITTRGAHWAREGGSD